MTSLKIRAQERSTYVVTVNFIERSSDISESPVTIVPNSIFWSLLDKDGNIVNNRDAIQISPAVKVSIILHGDDLALSGDYSEERYLVITGTYDSPFGSDLEFVQELSFQIDNLIVV